MITEPGPPTREQMMREPFNPAPFRPEHRNARSFEYIAFYLGEINDKLGKLVDAVETGKITANVGAGLHGLTEAIRQK